MRSWLRSKALPKRWSSVTGRRAAERSWSTRRDGRGERERRRERETERERERRREREELLAACRKRRVGNDWSAARRGAPTLPLPPPLPESSPRLRPPTYPPGPSVPPLPRRRESLVGLPEAERSGGFSLHVGPGLAHAVRRRRRRRQREERGVLTAGASEASHRESYCCWRKSSDLINQEGGTLLLFFCGGFYRTVLLFFSPG